MEDKKYLDLSGLQLYDSKIKEYVSEKISTATDTSLGVVKGGEQISVDNNGELHLIKLNDTTSGLNLQLSGTLAVGSQFTVSNSGNVSGISLSIGTGNQFNVDNRGNIQGSGISIGTGSQFTVDNNGDVSISENNQLKIGSKISINRYAAAFGDVSIGLGYISGSNFAISGEGISWSTQLYLSDNESFIKLNNGYIEGNTFTISGGGVNLSSGCHIQIGNKNSLGIRIETINNTPSFCLQNNNILDSNGSRINSAYLTGQIGEGVSFAGLTQTQIDELKTVLGI